MSSSAADPVVSDPSISAGSAATSKPCSPFSKSLAAKWFLAERSRLVGEWRRLRAAGMPPGCQSQRAIAVRMALLEMGLWEEIYRE